MMEVAVLGTGTIGSTVAYNLTRSGIDVRVTDIIPEVSEGHAIDVAHAGAHAAHPVGHGATGGRISATESSAKAVEGVGCVVVTASAARPAGANQRGGRKEWLEDNLAVADAVGNCLQQTTPRPVVVVTNPVDVITYELSRRSGWPSSNFLGYSLSETARLAYALADKYDVSYEEVSCPVLGEHGEYIVPVFSHATVRDERIDIDATERQRLLDYVREIPYTVMGLRGASESSRWVTGRGVALVAKQILEGGLRDPVGLSTPLNGAYGYSGVALSVPVILGDAGVRDIVQWDLSAWEQSRMDEAYRSVAADIPR